MNEKKLEELLLQALEQELGGLAVYATAVTCALREDLKAEWTFQRAQTQEHVRILEALCALARIDKTRRSPGRDVVRHNADALVKAMTIARSMNEPESTQLVACECIVLAETKDLANWYLLGKCTDHVDGAFGEALRDACDVVEDEEARRMHHATGWYRSLWGMSLGLNVFLPAGRS